MNEEHLGGLTTCRQLPCDRCWSHTFCENLSGMTGEGRVSYHENPDCPPAFQNLQHSSSATRYNKSDEFPTSGGANCDDGGHPVLLPSGQLKFTHRWPAPSTLKYFAVSASHQSVDPSSVPILEHGRGSALPHSGRWTSAKIWMLLSSLAVFVYGTMVLLWASVTWFDGELNLIASNFCSNLTHVFF